MIMDNIEILLVSENTGELSEMEELLGDYRLNKAFSILEAREHLDRNTNMSVMILDDGVKGMEKLDFLKELNNDKRFRNLNIILLTDGRDSERELFSMQLGVADYVRKPFNMETLLIRVQRHLIIQGISTLLEMDIHTDEQSHSAINEKLIKVGTGVLERERMFRALFEQANIGITIGFNGKYMESTVNGDPTINKKFVEITGRTMEELQSLGWEAITHPDDVEEDRRRFKQVWNGEIEGFQMEKRYVKPDGSSVWVDMKISKLDLDDPDGFYYICFVEDISKRKRYEETLKESEHSKAVFLSNLPGLAYRCKLDRQYTMEFVSEGCKLLTGYNPESLVDNRDISFNDIILPEHREHLWNRWQEVVAKRTKLSEEYQIRTANGQTRWVFEQAQPIYNNKGEVEALEGLIIDVTQRKNNEIELKYLNEHDMMTGLYNRFSFAEYLKKMKHFDDSVAVLVNIKNFSLLNLTYGYDYAEEVIIKIARNFEKLIDENIKLYHISIDRFLFIIEGKREQGKIKALLGDMVSKLDSAMQINTIQGFLGVLPLKGLERDVDRILKYSSIAAKSAAELQNTRYCYFNDQMEESIIRREQIQRELTDYVYNPDTDKLHLVYQPIVEAESLEVDGFEALARFKSQELGVISPLEFIEIAEETQLIVPLGRIILKKALSFHKECIRNGFYDLKISINISAIQLLREDFITDLISEATLYEVDLEKINIEITESVFSKNFDVINGKLRQLKKIGVGISIDDFGTGYSSLSRESELDVHCLKIDRAFINRLETLGYEESITSDIISMAHKMGHWTVAEGVETKGQMDYLVKNKCDYLQGYYFSKPLKDSDALDFMKRLSQRV